METEFWLEKWREGQIGFHNENYNELLLKYFPLLEAETGESVLVPLCGKSKDMIWLNQQGLQVVGVELSDMAVEDFFKENNIPTFVTEKGEHFNNFSFGNLLIKCGDFFKLNKLSEFDYIYDRASLVALPSNMRQDYAKVITNSLKIGGRYLLISFEYDQREMDGPPFSVTEEEVRHLYSQNFDIELLESSVPKIEGPKIEGPKISQLGYLLQKVYLLTRK